MSENVVEFVRDLRALADFYTAHPTLPIPVVSPVNAFVYTRAELADAARALSTAAKGGSFGWFYLRKQITPSLILDINVERAKVCTPRVVGTKLVPAQAERFEEVLEWDCGPVLTDPADLGLVAVAATAPVVEYGGSPMDLEG